MSPFLQAWVPRTTPVSLKERSRSALGALIGILATGWICRMAVGPGTSLPILVAPMGASAVLLFAVPSSPLAQPWSLIGGNLVAALVGVTAARLIPDPFLAAAVAVGLAIGLMMTARCVHPPSGAVALTAVLGGRAVTDLGYGFVLWPLGANSLLLLAVALLFNGLAGRNYPHRPLGARADTATRDPPSAARVGFTPEDLDAVLAEYDQLLEVDRGDLEAILRDAEIRSYRRRSGQATCATIMARDVVAVAPGAPIREALDLLRAHRIKVLPVTDEGARVLGLVTQTDLLDKSAWGRRGPRLTFGRRVRLTLRRGSAPHGSVADIMTAPVVTVRPDTRLADLVRLMARTGLHHLPVVEADGRLAGIVAQSDLIVSLLAEASDARRDGEAPAGPAA
ncbi:HPP family protein [Lichenibacterium ramalinae]|uniref:HPP family protein n=1 Tax=Lichenibacterium ramalinae TaxID=2316527 RepID=A0A4Q2RIU2_9HYPH|nr:HPP family protein [Lichenibacterium ramalinae]RYB07190.1 HPP family protein [Lichenibacterium ramalinae]